MRAVAALSLILTLTAAVPAQADEHDDLPLYSGAEFRALYEHAVGNTLPNLEHPEVRYEVTGEQELDERIWELALQRGYQLRPTASDELASADGVPMQPQAAEAWVSLRDDARASGMRFIVSSAYRSPTAQRSQFLEKLSGTSEGAINETLRWYSIPGTSKHHGGYALDFRYSDGTFGDFRSTPDYAWLAEDNFARPKRHGLIPSYPDDVEDQGPNPEPWEFVWVGEPLVRCGLPVVISQGIAGPAAALIDEVSRCPGGATIPEVPDWLLG